MFKPLLTILLLSASLTISAQIHMDNLGGTTRGMSVRSINQEKNGCIILYTPHERFIYDNSHLLKAEQADNKSVDATLPSGEKIFAQATIRGRHYVCTATTLYLWGQKLTPLTSQLLYPCGIVEGEDSSSLYIGTANSLVTLNIKSRQIVNRMALPVVKTLLKEGTALWMGTDDGLFLLKNDSLQKIEHDAYRPETSLASNVVWALFKDRDGNMWIGTDDGVSVLRRNPYIQWHYITDITHLKRGCKVEVLMTDSKKRLWLGGSDGLIGVEHFDTPQETFCWYKMNDPNHPIGHNHIRALYEDTRQRLWVGGDGGLMLLDEQNHQFRTIHIEGDLYNWVYDIRQDRQGRLEVTTTEATYLLSLVDMRTLERGKRQKYEKASIVDANGEEWQLDHHSGYMWSGGTDRFAFATREAVMKARATAEPNEDGTSRTFIWLIGALVGVCAATLIFVLFLRHKLKRERLQREQLLIHAQEKEQELQRELVATAKNEEVTALEESINDSMLKRFTQLVEENMENPDLSPAMLSRLSGINQKQIYRKLKQLTGMTTAEYIRHVRLDHAASLIRRGQFTAAEVMYRVGFSNASYFARAFAAQHGMTPRDYKKSIAGAS